MTVSVQWLFCGAVNWCGVIVVFPDRTILFVNVKSSPGISACNLWAKSLILARTSSRQPYIDPVVSNDIATSRSPPGGRGAAAPEAPLLPAVTLAVFDKDFVIDAAFFNDALDVNDVSPMLAPDLRGTTVVTVPPSITTLDAFFVREGFEADESFFDEAFFIKLAASSLSSIVIVEAFRRAGGVGEPTSPLLLVDRAAVLWLVVRFESLAGLPSGVAKEDDALRLTPGIVVW